jgi:hypothetical protein
MDARDAGEVVDAGDAGDVRNAGNTEHSTWGEW